MSNLARPLTFLALPVEIRAAVYQYAIPCQRLFTHKLCDPEFQIAPDASAEVRRIPALLFVCQRMYEETALVFYSKAILEISPPNYPRFSFHFVTSSTQNDPFGAEQSHTLNRQFSFLPKRFLVRIQQVHIYSDQIDAISADCYESLLKWLMINTDVQEIQLSRLLKTRLRKGRVGADGLTVAQLQQGQRQRPSKTVCVYSQSSRTPWEKMKQLEAHKRLAAHELLGVDQCFFPEIQMYILSRKVGFAHLQPDPRWDVKPNDSDERLVRVQKMGDLFDQLASQDPKFDNISVLRDLALVGESKSAENSRWLYQVVFYFAPKAAEDALEGALRSFHLR